MPIIYDSSYHAIFHEAVASGPISREPTCQEMARFLLVTISRDVIAGRKALRPGDDIEISSREILKSGGDVTNEFCQRRHADLINIDDTRDWPPLRAVNTAGRSTILAHHRTMPKAPTVPRHIFI